MSRRRMRKKKSRSSSKSCPSSSLQTNLFVDLEGRWSLLTDADFDYLATSFQQVYNALLPQDDDLLCDGYRRIQGVSLQMESESLPGYESSFRLLYTVDADCLGCADDDVTTLFPITTSGQAAMRKLPQQHTSRTLPATSDRNLGRKRHRRPSSNSESEEATSNPTQGRVTLAYARAIQEAIDLGILSNEIEGLQALVEVRRVDCDPEITEFEVLVNIDFTAMVPGDQVARSDLTRCREGFALTYNQLSVCDSQFRQVQSVNVQSRRTLQSEEPNDRHLQIDNMFFPLAVTWVVAGTCRGCPSNVVLFDDVSGRALEITSTTRRLDESPCYCPVQQVSLPLTEDVFQVGYQGFVDEQRELGTVQDIVGVANVQEAQ